MPVRAPNRRQPGNALSVGGRPLPGIEARPPSDQRERPRQKVASHSGPGLWFFNWKMWLRAKQFLAEALQPLQLAPREFWLLAMVHDAPMPQHELAALCGLDPSTLVPLLDALERRGWVARRRDPRDRRVQRIS
ncbi:MAG: MarR family winged helix-turn-helix transcriptional regulator, partial [Terriglobales bacterium]